LRTLRASSEKKFPQITTEFLRRHDLTVSPLFTQPLFLQ
jgi:hypothetical protein